MTTWSSSLAALLVTSMGVASGLSGCSSQATPSDANPPPAVDAGPDIEQDAGPPCVEPADGGLPTDVFCIGLYANHDSKRYDKAALPYTPGVVLWSDGAEKQRFLSVPPGTQIDTSDMDVWKFPVGTKAWKEFRVNGKLIETRLFWKRETAWLSGTYVWDDATAAASLNTSTKALLLDSGYEIPTAKDCGKCHHGGADNLLGVEAVALALPTAKGVTLASLVAAGSLSNPPANTSITLPEDSTGKAGAALGYLHANCGMPCHSSRGLGHETELLLRLRANEFWPAAVPVAMTDTYVATLSKDPTTASVAQQFPGAYRITPGAHDKSLVWQLSHIRGKYQMPPLVSHSVDEIGTQQLADWIDALPH